MSTKIKMIKLASTTKLHTMNAIQKEYTVALNNIAFDIDTAAAAGNLFITLNAEYSTNKKILAFLGHLGYNIELCRDDKSRMVTEVRIGWN